MQHDPRRRGFAHAPGGRRGHEKAASEYRFTLVTEQLVNELNNVYQ